MNVLYIPMNSFGLDIVKTLDVVMLDHHNYIVIHLFINNRIRRKQGAYGPAISMGQGTSPLTDCCVYVANAFLASNITLIIFRLQQA